MRNTRNIIFVALGVGLLVGGAVAALVGTPRAQAQGMGGDGRYQLVVTAPAYGDKGSVSLPTPYVIDTRTGQVWTRGMAPSGMGNGYKEAWLNLGSPARVK